MNGIERQIDKLGRIVLPIEYRKRLSLSENSKVNVSICDGTIYITPTETKCLMCGSKNEIDITLGICSDCIKRVKEKV